MRALIISYQSQCKLIGTHLVFPGVQSEPPEPGLDKRNDINMAKDWTGLSETRPGQGSVTVLMSLL